MAPSTHNRWKRLSPYLDEALTLSEQERSSWLAAVRDQDPDLAQEIDQILKKQREVIENDFLEEQAFPIPDQRGRIGLTVGSYTLISPIGQGGMSTVWLAERNDGRFQRKVAVKFLSIALYGRGEERFRREGSIVGRLSHPHIAQLVDAGVSSSGEAYLVLEHVDGIHIDQYCDNHRLNVEERCRLFLDVIAAVAHAHANLIVHRDIKPSNVLVANDGQVKLLDFGIAKLLEHEKTDATLTSEGGAALTPQYAAPEQLKGEQVTTATDVYALGVLLYKLLSNHHPASSSTHSHSELVKAIVEAEPMKPSDICLTGDSVSFAEKRATTPEKLHRQLRGDLDTIIGKALKKVSAERYATANALADDLRRYLESEPISARPDSIAYHAIKFVRRNRVAVALSAVAVCAVVAGVVGTLIQARTVREERDFAFRQASRAESVTELQDFVLAEAGPRKSFTLHELLGRAEHIATRESGEETANRVELLISIGRHYWGEDEDANARRVLEQAYELSRGLSDPALQAKASCALASVLARNGESARAEDLINAGLRQIPNEPQYVLYRYFCLLRGEEVAEHNGAAQLSIDRLLAAQTVLKGSPFNSKLEKTFTELQLAEAYREAGRFREATAAFEHGFTVLTELGRDDTESAVNFLNNWALTLEFSGNPLEAEKKFARAIQVSNDKNGEGIVSPTTLANYAHVLRELARTKKAEDYALEAFKAATKLGDQETINQVHLELARIYRDEGLVARSNAMLDEVEPKLRHDLPAGHYAFAALASERALNAQAAGDLYSANRYAKQAMDIVKSAVQSGQQGAHYLPILLGRQSALELQMNLFDRAAADAEAQLSLAQKHAESGRFSANIGHAFLNLGRALQAQGKTNEARAAFLSAAEQLEGTLGPDHPDFRSARISAGLEAQ